MSTLLEKLTAYGASDYYGFHMPGHKRKLDMLGGVTPCQIDITEIDGLDDLHHAEGILREAQERAAETYHADETHFLVNGSTVGILSAILGVTRRGDEILVARNCHKSVYHALEMQGLHPVYVYPDFDPDTQLNTEISADDIRRALETHPNIRAAVIVSPTYDGIVSDVESIAEAVHVHDIPLIVDEAHGAHFGFHPCFPENANQKGADIVIHSLHKTLPSLTQTALLHINGERVDRRRRSPAWKAPCYPPLQAAGALRLPAHFLSFSASPHRARITLPFAPAACGYMRRFLPSVHRTDCWTPAYADIFVLCAGPLFLH